MVLYFTSNVVDPPALIYMGKDKFENEDLIKWGWDVDVWFHVDNLSSAHVYLRLQECKEAAVPETPPTGSPSMARPKSAGSKGFQQPPKSKSTAPEQQRVYCKTWDDIPEALLQDLAQLTKANSIDGNKRDGITVIYTPHSNLKKRPGMETGQVSFHNNKLVKKVFVKTRQNDIVNRLNKTKEERAPDLEKEKVDYERKKRTEKRLAEEAQNAEEKARIEEARKEKALRSYDLLFDGAEMKSNAEVGSGSDDDFM
ncbi:hypothetical protein RI367_007323 [Sorochytrium milnesiophthora]